MNKKQLYESIIKNVAKEVKKSLNESFIEEDDLQNAARFIMNYLDVKRYELFKEYLNKNENASSNAFYKVIDDIILHTEKDNNLL